MDEEYRKDIEIELRFDIGPRETLLVIFALAALLAHCLGHQVAAIVLLCVVATFGLSYYLWPLHTKP